MRIVCPKCELKGQVDMANGSAKTRIACVRCATTFDAVFADGRIQALLPQTAPVATTPESADSDMSVVASETVSPVEVQPELQLNFAPEFESAPAPKDDFLPSPTDDVVPEETLETSSPVSPQEVAEEFAWPGVETQTQEMLVEEETLSVVEMPLKSVDVRRVSESSDAYGLGVRLMRVSPMWLLLAGLSFISFIVLCNWLIKPDENNADAARMLLAADNHATNQSPNRVAAPNSTAQSPVNTQAAQPPATSGVAFLPAEAAAPTAPTATAAGAETIEKPAVEEKAGEEKAMVPASSSNQTGAAKTGGAAQVGKVTIQIGSYNEAAQAEERVANLKSAGYEAQSVSVEIPKRGTWYRVQSGRFVNRDEAERYGKQLREKGVVSSFITTDVQE
jgi:cell division protein FtsN